MKGADSNLMRYRQMADQKARAVWERYEYGRDRGHRQYCAQARRCERFYLGGGLQWSPEDLAVLQEAGRPAHEINLVQPAVNAAVGYQIHNRMDISYRPRGNGADDQLATAHSKVAMQIADQNQLHWKETEVFADGLIQQRGYFDIRLDFDDHLMGSVAIDVLDPLDVIPDPDAKGYSPNDWLDVLITRWLTLDAIELLYGKAARRELEARRPSEADFGEESMEEGRNKFGGTSASGGFYDAWRLDGDGQIPRVRVVEQRRWEMTRADVAIYPAGDIRPLNEGEVAPDGAVITKKMRLRPKITVATQDVMLHEDWSPYRRLMIVPYFPFFRRGITRGMVDAAISPQEALNKAMSQYLHILNTTANSGWIVQEGSLTNLTLAQLEDQGAKTGLVVEYKNGTQPPVKIQPNQIPTGIDRMIERAQAQMAEVTGINDAFKGMTDSGLESGVAIQSRQQAAQNSIALPLDNLARTRHLLAEHLLELVQQFYTEPRILRITEMDAFGKQQSVPLAINQPTDSGLFNDLTIGEYDVVITEQPMQVTFENSQFQQALELRKAGVMVPDEIVIRHSNLADKEEVAKAMTERGQQVDPTLAAKAELMKVQAEKTQAERVNKAVEAQYSAIQTAQTIATLPQTAGLADALLKSAGYVDRDAAPIVPPLSAPLPGAEPPPANTNPLTPHNPQAGITAGLESPHE